MVTLSQKANPTLNIMCADVTNFSTDQKFDMVVILGGLHHVHGHVEKVLHLMKNINLGLLKRCLMLILLKYVNLFFCIKASIIVFNLVLP